MKKLIYALLGLICVVCSAPTHAQGTVPLALSQTLDINGKPLVGALLYTYVVGTVAQPQNTYQDTGLSILNPWPLTADANGRLPMFYLTNGSTHIRLTDASGNVQYDNPSVLVLGASSGSGGSGSVDPTTLMSTGDLKVKYGTGPITGYVRANGLTIGNGLSIATERANADTQALWIYLYTQDPNLVVSGGRTGNALNDYNAAKTLTLPDWRGRAITALADMGNGATSVLTSTYAGCTPTTLGAACGSQNHTMLLAEIAAHQHSVFLKDPGHAHTVSNQPAYNGGQAGGGAGAGSNNGSAGTSSNTTGMTIGSVNGVANDNLTASTGSASPFTLVQPSMLATIYLKL